MRKRIPNISHDEYTDVKLCLFPQSGIAFLFVINARGWTTYLQLEPEEFYVSNKTVAKFAKLQNKVLNLFSQPPTNKE